MNFNNIGWSLGNDCPLHCKQCYSKIVRNKGQNLNKKIIDRVISQIKTVSAKTVNLGGNEPIYTNGLNPHKSLLPYILKELNRNGIKTGITSAGPTIVQLEKLFPKSLRYINDVDISIDSANKREHDLNRGQNGIYDMALKAVNICIKNNIPHSIIMCGMNWNFNKKNLDAMMDLCKKTNSNFRINPMKPTELCHKKLVLTPSRFFAGLKIISKRSKIIDLSDPAWACLACYRDTSGCHCGTNSFRIHSITPDGQIPISPCVYVHDFKVGNIVKQNLTDIINTPRFQAFSNRKKNVNKIPKCSDCEYVEICQGGCAARAYLHNCFFNNIKKNNLLAPDPYCYKEYKNKHKVLTLTKKPNANLVHIGYLCTGIFEIIK